MLTALALQLMQSVVRLPTTRGIERDTEIMDSEVMIATSCEKVIHIAHKFLGAFLKK